MINKENFEAWYNETIYAHLTEKDLLAAAEWEKNNKKK